MQFTAPEFFLILPIYFILPWLLRKFSSNKHEKNSSKLNFNFSTPVRIIILFACVLALTKPKIVTKSGSLDLWVLLDRSASTEGLVKKFLPEWQKLLEKKKLKKDDRVFYLNYAGEVAKAEESESEALNSLDKSKTKTATAIQTALSLKAQGRQAKILVFTDGYSTEELLNSTSTSNSESSVLSQKLFQSKIPLHYRLLTLTNKPDFSIAKFSAPQQVNLGQAFILETEIWGNRNEDVDIKITRNGKEIFSDKVTVANGIGRLKIYDRLYDTDSSLYEATIYPTNDQNSANNFAKTITSTNVNSQVLLVTKYKNDPLLAILKKFGIRVKISNEPLKLTSVDISNCKSIIINNIPAHEFQSDFLKSLIFFVKNQGGGLLMVGGKHSFGLGGYYQSAIDELLPVSMELKQELRKLAVAMAIVIDRSGSMSVNVEPGLKKIDLANEGSARSIELLSDIDFITVFAVDSKPHEVVPMMSIRGNKDNMISMVRRIESMGGGIFVYDGLAEAWKSLQKTQVGQRHIILFSDANDSEQPGNYKKLLKEMVENKCTVSVIGLGTRTDADAEFLTDIAKRGNGRIFFTNTPQEIPAIFSQETVSVSSSSFIEEKTNTKATGIWREISSKNLPWLKQVDGYNLNYLKTGASSALNSADEYDAPLVAFMPKGQGRTASIAFPLGGEYSKSARSWDNYANFVLTLTNWLIGDKIPPGLNLKTNVIGDKLKIDLLYDSSINKAYMDKDTGKEQLNWSDRIANKPPKILIARKDNSVSQAKWQRIKPGNLRSEITLKEGEVLRGSVIAGKHSLPFGPVIIGKSEEWHFEQQKIIDLKKLAELSGGKELTNFAKIWQRNEIRNLSPINNLLYWLILLLLLYDAWQTRTGQGFANAIKVFAHKINKRPDFAEKEKSNKKNFTHKISQMPLFQPSKKHQNKKANTPTKKAPKPEDKNNDDADLRESFQKAKHKRLK